MSEHQETNQAGSPLVTSFLVFSIVLVAIGGGFGAWKFYAKQEASRVAALEAEKRARLGAYKIDPETGKLQKADGVPENIWPEEGLQDFSLVDQTGRTVTKETLAGRPWAACFVFTRCASHCLKIMAGMRQLYDELEGTDALLVTITVDPEYDTVDVMSDYAAGFQADPERWLFLTGNQEEIYRLIKESFLLPVREVIGPDRRPGYEVDHATEIMHVNAEGQVVGKYNGLKEYDLRRLAKALKQGPKERTSDPAATQELPVVGDFELTERSGEKVTNQDLLGQPWAVCFVFTRCAGPCLSITANMARLQNELGDAKVRLVTITVDPRYDTPKVLQNYADNFGADPEGWLFLTGEQEYLYRLLWREFQQPVKEFMGEEREKGFEVFHTADVLHIDAQGRIVKKYNGANTAEMTRLRNALLAEAEELASQSPEKGGKSDAKPASAEKPSVDSEGN